MDLFLCSDPSLGSVSQIVTAGAAVVAAGTGVYGVVNAVRSYRASIASAERQAENERRDQARFVHAIVKDVFLIPKDGRVNAGTIHDYVQPGYTRVESGSEHYRAYTEDMIGFRVILRNDSQEVISSVQLGVVDYDENDHAEALEAAHARSRFVLPSGEWKAHLIIPWTGRPAPSSYGLGQRVRATVMFTDARGNIWTRETGEPVLDFTGSH